MAKVTAQSVLILHTNDQTQIVGTGPCISAEAVDNEAVVADDSLLE